MSDFTNFNSGLPGNNGVNYTNGLGKKKGHENKPAAPETQHTGAPAQQPVNANDVLSHLANQGRLNLGNVNNAAMDNAMVQFAATLPPEKFERLMGLVNEEYEGITGKKPSEDIAEDIVLTLIQGRPSVKR